MSSSELSNILITGGTGFVGKAVVARLLNQPWVGRIFLLARPQRGRPASERVEQQLKVMFGAERAKEMSHRIVAIAGDLTSPGLGISPEDMTLLKSDCHQILHCGASTDFAASLAEARVINLEGTRYVLTVADDLRRDGVLRRVDYVSTAYVAGAAGRVVKETDLDMGQGFQSPYEQSKFEAENLIHAWKRDYPVTIHRPSIVVGQSYNGYTPHFKVLYWPLMILARNMAQFFVCNPGSYLDVVPVDYVADAIVALLPNREAEERTFLLTAGLGKEIKVRQLLIDAMDLAEVKRKPIMPMWLFDFIRKVPPLARLLPNDFWTVVDMAKPYHGYLRGIKTRFNPAETLQLLARSGVKPPEWRDYKHQILQFCLDSRWGKRLPKPEHTYYELPQVAQQQV